MYVIGGTRTCRQFMPSQPTAQSERFCRIRDSTSASSTSKMVREFTGEFRVAVGESEGWLPADDDAVSFVIFVAKFLPMFV